MSAFESLATIRWIPNPPEGQPRLIVGSGALQPGLPLDVNLGATHPLATSPGELMAGAIGAVVAWFAALELTEGGTQARELTAEVTLTGSAGGDGPSLLTGISCALVARVPNIDRERLQVVSRHAMDRCVEGLRLRAESLTITVEAILEGA